MNTYSTRNLLTGSELRRVRQRGLQASRSHQLQMERNEKQLHKIFRKFDLNGDGELTTKEFVGALKSMNPQLSDHAVRVAARQVDVDGDGVVDYKEFTAKLASDTQQLPIFLKGKRWHDSGDIIAGRDEPPAEQARMHEKQRYLRGLLKEHEVQRGELDAEHLALAMSRHNCHLTPDEVRTLTRVACGDNGQQRVGSAEFVQAATTGPVSALFNSKRHRDNGAILAWPETEQERAAAGLPAVRGGGYSTPRGAGPATVAFGSRVPARTGSAAADRLGAPTPASADDLVAGSASARVSKHAYVFEAGRERQRGTLRQQQPAGLRRTPSWGAGGVVPKPVPGATSLVLRPSQPPPPPPQPSAS